MVPACGHPGQGVTGRYQASCGEGRCALTGGQAISKLEGQIFTLLDYVLGCGKRDEHLGVGERALRIDMVFQFPGGQLLAVEYDGAYWHRDQEERDRRNARMIESVWGWCVVVRIREDPLTPLSPQDSWVPGRPDAVTCARLLLLHLMHLIPLGFREYEKVVDFLRASPRPLMKSDIRCVECRPIARRCLPPEILITYRRRDREGRFISDK